MKSHSKLSDIKGFLIDLDGVLYIDDKPIKGAADTVRYLKSKNIPVRFVTNTTTKSLDTLYHKITGMGLPVEKSEIISAPRAAAIYLKSLGDPVCYFCVNDDVINDFSGFKTSEDKPEIVVIGDIENRWNYDLMNRIFRILVGGADLVALHKGKYWHERDGLQLDIGAFVSGLEYASGKKATVIGKPNSAFYKAALDDLGYKPHQVAMIGDDIESDVGGAQKAGLKGILVNTGKYRKELVEKSDIQPDAVLGSIADLPEITSNDAG